MELKRMTKVENTRYSNISAPISTSDTTIKVNDIDMFPPAPNFAAIGTDNTSEAIEYTGIDEDTNSLTGCIRGTNGTIAKPWDSGIDIYHTLVRDNVNNTIENIKSNNKMIHEIPNTNLIINGELSIWQEETSFTNPQNKYTAEMMKCTGGTIKQNARGWGMDITGTTNIKYLAEDKDWKPYEGQKAMLSYSKDGEVLTEATTISSYELIDLTLSDCTLDWIKLELGEVATPMRFRGQAELLQLCQQYYYVYCTSRTLVTVHPFSATGAHLPIQLPIKMRVSPMVVINLKNKGNVQFKSNNGISVASSPVSAITVSNIKRENYAVLGVAYNAVSNTAGGSTYVDITDGDISFDARL